MSKNRLKLAQITHDDLAAPVADPFAAVPMPDETAPKRYQEVAAPANIGLYDKVEELTEAVRALLVMTGCVAKWCGNYWQVKRLNDDNSGLPPIGWKPARHGQRYRSQTGVAANATFEDWRRELNAFVGGLGK